MRGDKTTFILSREYESFTESLSDEMAGKLFKAILRHENGGEVEDIPAEIKSVWSFIKNRLESNSEAYKAKCEQNARNRSNDNNSDDSKTNDNETERTVTIVDEMERPSTNDNDRATDNDNDNDKENDKENDNGTDKGSIAPPNPPRKTQAAMVEDSTLSPAVKEKLLEWLKYKTERRESYKETGLRNLITVVSRQEREHGSTAVINVITDSMSNGWQGIIWDRIKNSPPPQRQGSDVVSSWLKNRREAT